nr:hypothetical protein RchiOBHm_Chr3g0454441 [Ipomoea batatas]
MHCSNPWFISINSPNFSSFSVIARSSPTGDWIIVATSLLMESTASNTEAMALGCLNVLSETLATNAFVFLPTLVLVISIFIGMYDDPRVEAFVLSTPDGFPWIIFSPSKAHLFTNCSSVSLNTCQAWWLKSILTESDKESMAAESATQRAADDPRPAPIGSSEWTTAFAGLHLILQIRKNKIQIS